MRPMVLTIKPKIPELSAKNQMVQHFSGNFRVPYFPRLEREVGKLCTIWSFLLFQAFCVYEV